MNVPNPYEHRNYRWLAALPLALIAISAFLVLVAPGIPKGVDLRGGLLITVVTDQPVDANALADRLRPFSTDVDVRAFQGPAGNGVEIELGLNERLAAAEDAFRRVRDLDAQLTSAELTASYAEEQGSATERNRAHAEVQRLEQETLAAARQVLSLAQSAEPVPADAHRAAVLAETALNVARENERANILAAIAAVAPTDRVSFKEVGSSLSQFFFEKTQQIILVSLALTAIVIFIVIRGFVASVNIVFGVVGGLAITAGAMALLQIPLTLATVAALLTLIALSLDTDVMLNIRALKRTEGTARERVFDAMQTGFLMNLTTFAAFAVLYAAGVMLQIATYEQIGAVVAIGAIADFIVTWFGNAAFILWYLDRKHGRATDVA